MKSHYLTKALAYIVLSLLAVFALVPIVAGAITAVKPALIWVASPPVWTFTPTLANFQHVLGHMGHLNNLRNSIIVATSTVLIALLLGAPAAYAFTRFTFKGSQPLLSWLISLRMIPPIVVGLPFYFLFYTLGLKDTYAGVILAYLSFSIPLAIWIMRGYFAELPPDMEESAMVDGCGRLDALRRVVLPQILPGIVATGLLVFIFAWNEFLLALILTGRDTQTLPVAAGTYVGRVQVQWGYLFATNMIIMVPVIVLAIVLQRHLVRGLSFGMID